MKYLGMLIIAFGLVDLGGSFADFDLWGTIGVQLPDALWTYSSYIEVALGYGVMSLAGKSTDQESDLEDEDEEKINT